MPPTTNTNKSTSPEQIAFFEDRRDAGLRLAQKLNYLPRERLLIMAIPNGGVPVGKQISQKLEAKLNPIFVHKLHLPGRPEAGFGAISYDGTVNLNYEIIETLKIRRSQVDQITRETFEDLKKRKTLMTKAPIILNPMLKTVVLVDDGLASGYTMLTAIRTIKKRNPRQIIVAIPTASDLGVKLLQPEVEEVVTIYLHPKQLLFDIAASYRNWKILTDEETAQILTSKETSESK